MYSDFTATQASIHQKPLQHTLAPVFDGCCKNAAVASLATGLRNKKAFRDVCAIVHYAE